MTRCAGIKRDGGRCAVVVGPGQSHCYAHDPGRAEERRRNASRGGKRGGRGRPQAELSDVKRRLSDLVDDVLEGRKDRGDAAVAGQLLNTYIRAVGVELKVREQQEIVERLEELEEGIRHRGGGFGRGA